MDVGAPFVTNLQAAVAVEPRARSFHDPAVAAQPLARLDALARDARRDASPAQLGPQRGRVIRLVGVQLRGALARAAPPAALDRLDGIHGFEHHARVVDVGRAQRVRERDAFGVDHKMALRARFASIRRIRAGFFAPPTAGTVKESTEARDQSSWSASAKRSRSTWCSFFQTPASCHSLSLRQQVVPEPQPSSVGSHDQGRLARRTKMMPRRQSRFEMRGLPPRGLSGSGGNNGSTTAHSSSLTIGFAIAGDFIKAQLTS